MMTDAMKMDGFGLLWFGKNDEIHCFNPGVRESIVLGSLADLPDEGIYLSNLTHKAFFSLLDDFSERSDQLLHDRSLFVSLKTIAEELGLNRGIGPVITEKDACILNTVRITFETACQRLGLNLYQTGVMARIIRSSVFKRTTTTGMKTPSIEEMPEAFSPAPHRWVNVPGQPVKGTHQLRVTVSRHTLYETLLKQPVPTGEWRRGDSLATPAVILNGMGDQYDVLVEATIQEPGSQFPSALTTDAPTRLFTGTELKRAIKEGIPIEIYQWWHGPTQIVPALPETNKVSLADGVMLEMIYRSWRENPEVGFWVGTAERLTLHHLASALRQVGIEVTGYGSGKLLVRRPNERQARQDQDQRLLKEFHPYGVQLPLAALGDHDALKELIDCMTDIQVLALADTTLLGKIEVAITDGDEAKLNMLLNEADSSLLALFNDPETVAGEK
jgi:hypothetical protein